MIDIRQSTKYASYLSQTGWIVERKKDINYFIKKIPIVGSFIKIQRPKTIDLNEIEHLTKKYRAFQILLEPGFNTHLGSKTIKGITSHGFKKSKNPFLPTKTVQIDLTQTKEEIYKNFSKKCRYSIRKGEGLNIKQYSSPFEIEKFREGWKNCVNLKRFVPSTDQLLKLRKSFPNNHSLFLASHNINSRIIGGVIFTRNDKDFSYYWQSFADIEGRSTLSQYSLLYYGILWAKKMGCKIFDMEGIFDSRFPNKDWLGFTHFKKSFGGVEVLFPKPYVRFRLPF